ncbi:MAG: fructosamine kinase family protein [Gammaproteobacteria bacterium]
MYQLYHLLNHLNLFGASYLERVKAMMGSLLDAA